MLEEVQSTMSELHSSRKLLLRAALNLLPVDPTMSVKRLDLSNGVVLALLLSVALSEVVPWILLFIPVARSITLEFKSREQLLLRGSIMIRALENVLHSLTMEQEETTTTSCPESTANSSARGYNVIEEIL